MVEFCDSVEWKTLCLYYCQAPTLRICPKCMGLYCLWQSTMLPDYFLILWNLSSTMHAWQRVLSPLQVLLTCGLKLYNHKVYSLITTNTWFQFQQQQGGSLLPSPSCRNDHMNTAASYTTTQLPAAETTLGAFLQIMNCTASSNRSDTTVGVFTPKYKDWYSTPYSLKASREEKTKDNLTVKELNAEVCVEFSSSFPWKLLKTPMETIWSPHFLTY